MLDSKPIRVILVDDHAVVRKGIREFLEEDGIIVLAEADNGDNALPLIRDHKPDVVILDIKMPGASGIDITRTIRNQDLQTAVLILTAYDDDPYIMAGIQAGANGYVLKSAEPDEIIRAVHAVYDGQSAVDPAVASKLMTFLSGQQTPLTNPIADPLSNRELEVLALTAKGLTNKAIGHRLGISDRTVQGHLANIFEKFGVSSRTEAVVAAVKLGWLDV